MMRGMFSAISGLRVHQTMLDVTANNIANVNTIGFKGQRVSFADALSQMESGASAPSATLGGTNAQEVGLGVELDGIDTQMTSGAIQSTGNPLDCAIQGDGFFRVTNDPTGFANMNYTRAGNFQEDANGNLVTQDGYYVVGYALDSTGAPTTTQQTITIPPGTTSVSIGSNGIVTTVDSTGASTPLAAISLAKFPNDAGLLRGAANMFQLSNNSGAEQAGTAGTGGLGTVTPGAIEMSNVDLAQEFTNMITAERGFQANSRTITTADEMLQELVNLKH